ncbi:MAG: zinc ribbon domain-containing protein [Chloroflexota bacterium]|nr:zinc ribbon domain-containing protein [Chloroflexota bacterium]
MIYCPNCGTANRKGSRFCSECGKSLPSTGTRCPMCGTINPVSNVYCEACTARLLPMTSAPEENGKGDEDQPLRGTPSSTVPLGEAEGEQTAKASAEGPGSEDWLEALRESADEAGEREEDEGDRQIKESAQPPNQADLPDWLRDMGPIGGERQRSSGRGAFWLSEDSAEETASEEGQAEYEVGEREDYPEEGRRRVASGDETSQDETSEDEGALRPDAEAADVSDWVADLRERTDGASTRPGRESSAEEESLKEEAEVGHPQAQQGRDEEIFGERPKLEESPQWLSDLMEEPPADRDAPSVSTEAPPADIELRESPRSADLPDWMRQLRPRGGARRDAPRDEPETEGLLRGLQGLIPPTSPGIESPSLDRAPSPVVPSEVSRARAELLQSLLGQSASSPRLAVGKERSGSTARPVEQWLVAIVLLVTVLGMLLFPLLTGEAPQLTQPAGGSEAPQLYEIVNALDSSDEVLVAFDYGPPEADELNGVAQPVLEHLVDSGAGISIVSTRPEGPPMAVALMGEIADSSDRYRLLGYRPGAGTAVSQLLAAADERPTLLLIVTTGPGALQRWVEQASALYGDQLPVIAVGSALLQPVTSPYLDANAGQLRAAVHGFREAASYEALRGAVGEATQRLDALAAGHIAIVALMIAGAVVHGLGGAGGRGS